MADITARLVWYRLGETCTNMAERYEKFLEWYEQFSWKRVDILDMLFLGWLLAAFLVVGCINLYLRFFGRPRAKGFADGAWSVTGSGHGGATNGESCQWINSTISWLYLHYENTPEIVETWLRALNNAIRKQTGDAQVKFERIQPGSLPPKFTRIKTEVGPRDSFTILTGVEASDMTFLMSSMQQTGPNIKVINSDVVINKLHGQLKVFSQYVNNQIEINSSFLTKPDINMTVRSRNLESQGLDNKTLENLVRDAIGNAVTTLHLSPKGGYPLMGGPTMMHDRYEAHQSLSLGAAPRTTALRDRRLLVKVIKANGLGDKQFGCSDPYCIVQMDDPPQKHTTSVVKNTVNPFWDEHFLFDLDNNTQQVRFDLYDREKPPGDDQLGHAILPMSELKKSQSTRQIVPLQGRPGGREGAAGSLTAEFLFMEPAEAQQMGLSSSPISDSLSPRRRIETQRTVMPGGTVVTTTTMTTEKPRDQRLDGSFMAQDNTTDLGTISNTEEPYNIVRPGSTGMHMDAHYAALSNNPNKVQKTDSYRDSSPYSNRSFPYGAGAEASMTGSQAGNFGRSLGSPQLTITSPSPNLDKTKTLPLQHVSDHPQYEDSRSLGTTSQASHDTRDMKKSKSFASAIRKRFSRPKKPRSHSADRAGSLRDANLLKPPENATKTTDDLDTAELPEGSLRKSRSHSFSNSLRRIFKKKRKDGEASSRASSISRASTRGYGDSPYDTSPQLGRDDQSPDYSRDHYGTMYSTSVPASSPLYDH